MKKLLDVIPVLCCEWSHRPRFEVRYPSALNVKSQPIDLIPKKMNNEDITYSFKFITHLQCRLIHHRR